MNREKIPDDVRRFILTSIPSVPFLEAMLLIRNEPDRAWDAKLLARRLYLSEKPAAELLDSLHGAGYLARVENEEAGYRYAPEAPGLSEMADRVADVYAKHMVEVTNLIHSNLSKQAQHFADAFKWRKDS